jgi:retinol dehydrogenase-14
MEKSMSGKVCLITGASSGLGRATALALANRGATVVMVCRNQAKGEAARSEIAEASGNPSVDLLLADLSSQQAIRQLVQEFQAKHEHLHVLVNSAGGIYGPRMLTVDGLELTFALDHLAYFLLANLLLDVLRHSAPARIINVTSDAHRMGPFNFNNLQGESRYSGLRAYGQAKLANIMFTYDLARRLEGTGVTVNCMYPGFVRTNFGRHKAGIYGLFVAVFSPLMKTPEKGAETIIYLASSPEVEGVSGKYFINKKEARSSKASYDEAMTRRLWEVSAELTNLST